MPQYDTAANIINAAASECGMTAVTDPYASTDPAFIQLRNILTSAGRELIGLNGNAGWQRLIKTFTLTTLVPPDTGIYDLPVDFGFMIDQTGWTPTNRLPLGGPLSAQDWTYLVNTNLASSTIYVSFRVAQGKFNILPMPPPTGVIINYEYMSRFWVATAAFPTVLAKDAPTASDDVILYEPILITKFLKLRFLEAKGFDTIAASKQFEVAFMQWTGNDISAPVLSMARMRTFPYLGWRNIPETGYGLP